MTHTFQKTCYIFDDIRCLCLEKDWTQCPRSTSYEQPYCPKYECVPRKPKIKGESFLIKLVLGICIGIFFSAFFIYLLKKSCRGQSGESIRGYLVSIRLSNRFKWGRSTSREEIIEDNIEMVPLSESSRYYNIGADDNCRSMKNDSYGKKPQGTLRQLGLPDIRFLFR